MSGQDRPDRARNARNTPDRARDARSGNRGEGPWARSRKDPHRYDDLIGLERPEIPGHPRMSLENRAAQFAPFAALTGFENVIRKTAEQSEKENS